MPTPLWIGDPSTRLDPKCPIFETSKDGPRWTMIYNGQYSQLIANYPARLSNVNGVSADLYVDTVRVEQAPGNRGIMTITLTPAPIADYTMSDNEVDEVEFVEVQKPLIQHPIFLPASEDSTNPNAGKYELSTATNSNNTNDYFDIQAWENEPNPVNKTNFQYQGASGLVTLSSNAQQYAMRIMKGQDSYVLYTPVCRQTVKGVSQPQNSMCGTIGDPPDDININGYQYLQTADRASRDAIWTRTKEWTGADYIDDEIYPQG
jgi:hypothetical protein